MENDFDVVSIGVEHERRVIAGVIRPLTGSAIVLAACADRFSMKAVDRRAIGGLKGQVRAPRRSTRRRRRICGRDEELIGPEKTGPFPSDRDSDDPENRRVKSFRRREIANDELNVVDETASMELGSFHELPITDKSVSRYRRSTEDGPLVLSECEPSIAVNKARHPSAIFAEKSI